MQPIDHIFMGVALGLCSPERSVDVFVVAIAGSLYPDADLVCGRPGTIGYLTHHRALSHSLLIAPVITAFLAYSTYLIWGNRPFWVLFCWSLAGLIGHLALDVLNSFGTALWLPMNRRKESFDVLYEFDLAVSAILIFSIVFQFFGPTYLGVSSTVIGLCSGVILCAYIGWRLLSRYFFQRQTFAHINKISSNIIRQFSVVPASYWRWKGIIATSDDHYVIRQKDRELSCEKRPRISIPQEFRIPEVQAYEKYARHLDVTVEGLKLSLQNLVYSPKTYRLDVYFTPDPSSYTFTISLPGIGYSEY